MQENIQLINSKERQKAVFEEMAKSYLEVGGVSESEAQTILSRAASDPSFWEAEYQDPAGLMGGMSTMDAIRCLLDEHRTSLLIDGIFQSVEEMKHVNNHITAIDAGTGTGVLAIGLVEAGCDKVYALEINAETAKITKKFIDSLGYSDQINVIQCDATKVILPQLKEKPANILVSENLSAGLFDEPQFEIISHLSAVLTEDAKIIPYTAENLVSLAHGDWEKADKDDITAYIRLPNLQRLSKPVVFAKIESKKGMGAAPTIRGRVSIDVEKPAAVNTLLIGSRFRINDCPNTPILYEDTAMFLGGSYALHVPKDIKSDGEIVVDLEYPAGKRIDFTKVEVRGSEVYLR